MDGGTHCGPILVVEDDESLRKWLADLLRQEGHDVRVAADGAEAVAASEEEEPAVAILDVCLPVLSGYEVCRRLRERYGAGVAVLFISGERTESVDRVGGLLIGGDDYLVKPFAPDELLARVAVLLRRSDGSRRAEATSSLTPREHEVFELLARGLPNSEIARLLVISPKTVGTHLEHIYGKLGVRSRMQALAAGYRNELLPELSEEANGGRQGGSLSSDAC
jgi:DNA-binding response OmpR family regulator